jgi:hypothetical protein
MVKWFRGPGGRIGVNEIHAPILLVHWEGRIDGQILGEYFTWKVRRLGAHVDWGNAVMIHDLTRVVRPSPTLRKAVLERLKETREATSCRVLRNIAVVNNPVIAGSLRALDWVSGHRLAETVRSLPAALEVAREALVADGRRSPSLNPEQYNMPSRAPSAMK